MAAMEYRKTYVEVLCRIDVDGQVTPLSIIWRDGRTFPIDRVEEAIRRASARVGAGAPRTRCQRSIPSQRARRAPASPSYSLPAAARAAMRPR